ncbi:Alanine--tRNA ligase [Dissostichus eleginoides]|uniref:Alanine--tRNA ligase n=1 Tax=Dissostichus eleginoides TaxID=100907 RepID=A0AAD9EYX8_DISEL|nr:Alanine--tRNA ligase [Dissostichus eleginoides]
MIVEVNLSLARERWRVSVLLGRPGPNVHSERTPPPHPPICCIFLGCLLSPCPPPPPLLLLLFQSSLPPHLPVWVSRSRGPRGWRGIVLRWGSCAELAMPYPSIL